MGLAVYYIPVRINKISPNLTSVPCAARHALRCFSGIGEVSKQLKSFRVGSSCCWRQLWKSIRIPRPTMPFSANAVTYSKFLVSHSFINASPAR